LVGAADRCVHTNVGIGTPPGDSKPRAVVLGSAYTQEIRMIWLLTALLVVALIVSSLRIGAWFLLKYDAGNRN